MDAGGSFEQQCDVNCHACCYPMLSLIELSQTTEHNTYTYIYAYFIFIIIPFHFYNVSMPSEQNVGLLVDGGH